MSSFWSVVSFPVRAIAEVAAAVTLGVWRACCSHPPRKAMPAVPTFVGDKWTRRCGACGAEVTL
jgi:hypothetical protein